MAIGTILDRANRAKVQFGDGVPSTSTPGNIYIDDTNGDLYVRYGFTWKLLIGSGSFSYIKITGDSSLTDYAELDEGIGISLSRVDNVITIKNDGILTINNNGPDITGNIDISGIGEHHTSHENNGSDEISVSGLSGVLADPQNAGQLLGINLAVGMPSNGDIYIYNSSSGDFELGSSSGYDDTPVFYKDGSRLATGDFNLDSHDLNNVVEVNAPAATAILSLSATKTSGNGQVILLADGSTTNATSLDLNGTSASLKSSGDSWSTSTGIEVSVAGEINFWDSYHNGSNWLAPIPFANSISEWNDARTVLGGADGSLLALILAASGASPTLQATAIGFGSGSNLLTGDVSKFTIDSTNSRLNILSGSSLQLVSSAHINFGGTSAGSYGIIKFNSAQSIPSLSISPNSSSNNLFICSSNNIAVDYFSGRSAQTNPILWIQSGSSTASRYLSLTHNQTDALISSGFGSIGFADANRAASTWSSGYIKLSSSYQEWSDIKTLIGSEGSLFAAIWQARLYAYLPNMAVGYGSASNALTGNTANLAYDYTNFRLGINNALPAVGLHLGSGTPNKVSTTPTSNDAYISARLEVDGISYFDNDIQITSSATLLNNIALRFGTSTVGKLIYSTSTTPNSLVLGLPSTSNALIICENADTATAWNYSLQTNPTLYIQSNTTTVAQRIGIWHDTSHSRIASYTGSIMFSDAYKSGSWVTNGIRLSINPTEWDQIKSLLGGTEGSILGAIYAASLVGGSGGSVTLANHAVAYGIGTLTGDASKLYFDYTNVRLGIGKAGPGTGLDVGSGSASHLNTSSDMYVTGGIEADGISYFDGYAYFTVGAIFNNNISAYFGTSANASISFQTASANDPLVIGVPSTSNNLIICEQADIATNWNKSLSTNPTLIIQSADSTTPAKYMSTWHDGSYSNFYSGAGSFRFDDITRSGSIWVSAGVRLFSSSAEWSSLSLLGLTGETSLVSKILTAADNAALTNTYIGYGGVSGSSSNRLIGSSYLTYNSYRHVLIGTGSPGHITTSDNDALYVQGKLEVDYTSYFDGSANFYSNVVVHDAANLYIGSGTTSDACITWNTASTYDCLNIGVSSTGRTLILSETADVGTNWNHANESHPTLYIQSSNSGTVAQYLKMQHNGTQSVFSSGSGGFSFDNGTLNNSITGSYSIGAGYGITDAGNFNIVNGQNINTNGCGYSNFQGQDITAISSKFYVDVRGRYIETIWSGARHFGNQRIETDVSYRDGSSMGLDGMILGRRTTNAVPVILLGSESSTISPLYVPNKSVLSFDVTLIGVIGVGLGGGYIEQKFHITARRNSLGHSAVSSGLTTISTSGDYGTGFQSGSGLYDTTNECVTLYVSGHSTKATNWTAHIYNVTLTKGDWLTS